MNTLFYLALLLFAGLFFGRAVKYLKLPNVTGYLLAGLLIGPHILKLIPAQRVSELELVAEMALGFIAFSIGAGFKLSYLKRIGIAPVIIAVFEALTASVLVGGTLALVGFPTEIALLLGAIAAATAPAATIMVIKQYQAKGPVTETLLSVVALDDAVALIAFGFAMAIVDTMLHPTQGFSVMTILTPLLGIVGSAALGFVIGLLFNLPLRFFKKDGNRLIITVGFIFLGSALASLIGFSPLLLCMSMGATLVNTSKAEYSILRLVDGLTPPIFVMFFVVSGAELDLTILPKVGLLGVLYIVLRIIGKVLGAYLGATVARAEETVRKYIGLTLIPQAGVAIGLALIASQALPEFGQTIWAVILSGTLVSELIGPVFTKIGLSKAGEITE